jgi:hypothetical protein
MQLFGDLDILSFVRISRPIGHVNRMDSKKEARYFTIILREVD